MNSLSERLASRAAKFHGHRCGGLAIGVKACEALAEKWGLDLESGEKPCSAETENLACEAENRSCSADAIQAILGCTVGNGALTFRDTGKQAFSFFDRVLGRALRICLTADLEGIPRENREAFVLSKSPGELFKFSKPAFGAPDRAEIFKSARCEICGELSHSGKIARAGGKTLCPDCLAALRQKGGLSV